MADPQSDKSRPSLHSEVERLIGSMLATENVTPTVLALLNRCSQIIKGFEERVANGELLVRSAIGPSNAQRMVDKQAEDGGLWFNANLAPEAYLQRALRELHAAVEADTAHRPETVSHDDLMAAGADVVDKLLKAIKGLRSFRPTEEAVTYADRLVSEIEAVQARIAEGGAT